MNEKKCTECHETKPLSAYNPAKHNRDGLKGYCKDCENIKRREYYEKRKDDFKEWHKTYHNKHREHLSEVSRKYQKDLRINDPIKYYKQASWRSLNQRCIDGCYANSPSVQQSPQFQAYHRKGILIQITREELEKIWEDNREYVLALIEAGHIPTLDRIDDNGHYSPDNIQIISQIENIQKRTGVSKTPQTRDKQATRESNQKYYRKFKSQGER